MKYKLELWKFDIFDYEETAAHLNEMAERGFALVKAGSYLALYKKETGLNDKKYAVELVPKGEEGESFLYICVDAGWKQVGRCNMESVVFTAPKGTVPIYTDSLTKYQNTVNVVNKSGKSTLNAIWDILLFVLMIYVLYNTVLYEDSGFATTLSILSICLLSFLSASITLINNLYLHRCRRAASDGKILRKASWIRAATRIDRYYKIALITIIFFWDIITLMESNAAIWKPAIIICCPILAFIGFLASTFQRDGQNYDKILFAISAVMWLYGIYIFVIGVSRG